jgi:hypothetical protein
LLRRVFGGPPRRRGPTEPLDRHSHGDVHPSAVGASVVASAEDAQSGGGGGSGLGTGGSAADELGRSPMPTDLSSKDYTLRWYRSYYALRAVAAHIADRSARFCQPFIRLAEYFQASRWGWAVRHCAASLKFHTAAKRKQLIRDRCPVPLDSCNGVVHHDDEWWSACMNQECQKFNAARRHETAVNPVSNRKRTAPLQELTSYMVTGLETGFRTDNSVQDMKELTKSHVDGPIDIQVAKVRTRERRLFTVTVPSTNF